MPYKIVMTGGKHCVVKADTGATVKCHDTHAKALAHQRALTINVSARERRRYSLLRLADYFRHNKVESD